MQEGVDGAIGNLQERLVVEQVDQVELGWRWRERDTAELIARSIVIPEPPRDAGLAGAGDNQPIARAVEGEKAAQRGAQPEQEVGQRPIGGHAVLREQPVEVEEAIAARGVGVDRDQPQIEQREVVRQLVHPEVAAAMNSRIEPHGGRTPRGALVLRRPGQLDFAPHASPAH
ncbi:MAG: hypothetical protein EXR72_15170 [Myxococcales bacterium]|nr:hypothetical protein [Myxococcales bacterium]